MACKSRILLVLLISGLCWTALGLEQDQMDASVVDGYRSSCSDESESDDGYYYQGDNGFVFVNEDSDRFNVKKQRVTGVTEKLHKIVPSKGDIINIPPPNTTAPSGLPHLTPIYIPTTRPTDPPEEKSTREYSALTGALVLMLYITFLLGICLIFSALIFLCGALVERNGLPLPGNLSLTLRLRPAPSSSIRRGGNKMIRELIKRVRANQARLNMPCTFERVTYSYRSVVEKY